MNVVFNELHQRVTDYLRQVGTIVRRGEDGDALVVARDEMPRITEALQALFDSHTPDDHGYCRRCRTGRWWRRRSVPCRIFLDAQIALFQTDPRPGRHAVLS